MPTDPLTGAWADQFGALLRDKCRQMIAVINMTGWDALAHEFVDPDRGGTWRLIFADGVFYIVDREEDSDEPVVLDLAALGVLR